MDKRIEELEKENQRLKEEIELYRNSPAANFYKALTAAFDKITIKINDESLKIKDDEFVESIIALSEKSEKIFKGLKEGLALITPETGVSQDSTTRKRSQKSSTLAI